MLSVTYLESISLGRNKLGGRDQIERPISIGCREKIDFTHKRALEILYKVMNDHLKHCSSEMEAIIYMLTTCMNSWPKASDP